MKKIVIITVIVLLFIGISIKDASAVLVETRWTGTTTFADPGNDFGLVVDETISGFACWDDDQITGSGQEEVQFGDPFLDDGVAFPENKIEFTFGDIVMTHINHANWEGGVDPTLAVDNGEVIGVNWKTVIGENGATVFTSAFLFDFGWSGRDGSDREVAGRFDTWSTSRKSAPVPEPTTIVLLGIGLAGLAGAEVRRRRKKKVVDKSQAIIY